VIPFVVLFGLFISPVGFTSEIIPDKWRLFYSLVLVEVSAQGAVTRKALGLPPMESVDQLTRELWGSRHTQENAKSPGSDGASPYLPSIVLALVHPLSDPF
jgi:hypothetical protein